MICRSCYPSSFIFRFFSPPPSLSVYRMFINLFIMVRLVHFTLFTSCTRGGFPRVFQFPSSKSSKFPHKSFARRLRAVAIAFKNIRKFRLISREPNADKHTSNSTKTVRILRLYSNQNYIVTVNDNDKTSSVTAAVPTRTTPGKVTAQLEVFSLRIMYMYIYIWSCVRARVLSRFISLLGLGINFQKRSRTLLLLALE